MERKNEWKIIYLDIQEQRIEKQQLIKKLEKVRESIHLKY